MKTRAYIFTVLTVALMVLASCTKNEYYDRPGPVTVVESFRVTQTLNSGFEGGETVSIGTSPTANAVNFLSQYPLREFIYEQNVTYDSIVRTTLNAQGDTIASGIVEFDIISRDTIGFRTDQKWLPIDAWDERHLLSVYIGLISEAELSKEISISIERTNNMDSNYDMQVFMPDSLTLAERLDIFDGTTNERYTFSDTETLTLLPGEHYTVVPNVPVYNEQGVVVGEQFGIKLNPIVFFQQVVTPPSVSTPQIRNFLVTVNIGADKVSSAFTFRYVPEEVYFDRQCWLELLFECKDLFNE